LPGKPVALTPSGTIILRGKLGPIINKNLELLGRGMYTNFPYPNPRGVALLNWGKIDLEKSLRGSHHGGMLDLRITRLPISEEELQKYLGKSYDPMYMNPGTVAHLMLNAAMKSSGRQPSDVLLRMFLIARQYDHKKDSIRVSGSHFRTTGPAMAESFRQESIAVASLVKKDINWMPEMRRPSATDNNYL